MGFALVFESSVTGGIYGFCEVRFFLKPDDYVKVNDGFVRIPVIRVTCTECLPFPTIGALQIRAIQKIPQVFALPWRRRSDGIEPYLLACDYSTVDTLNPVSAFKET